MRRLLRNGFTICTLVLANPEHAFSQETVTFKNPLAQELYDVFIAEKTFRQGIWPFYMEPPGEFSGHIIEGPDVEAYYEFTSHPAVKAALMEGEQAAKEYGNVHMEPTRSTISLWGVTELDPIKSSLNNLELTQRQRTQGERKPTSSEAEAMARSLLGIDAPASSYSAENLETEKLVNATAQRLQNHDIMPGKSTIPEQVAVTDWAKTEKTRLQKLVPQLERQQALIALALSPHQTFYSLPTKSQPGDTETAISKKELIALANSKAIAIGESSFVDANGREHSLYLPTTLPAADSSLYRRNGRHPDSARKLFLASHTLLSGSGHSIKMTRA